MKIRDDSTVNGLQLFFHSIVFPPSPGNLRRRTLYVSSCPSQPSQSHQAKAKLTQRHHILPLK